LKARRAAFRHVLRTIHALSGFLPSPFSSLPGAGLTLADGWDYCIPRPAFKPRPDGRRGRLSSSFSVESSGHVASRYAAAVAGFRRRRPPIV
jgi:hypothetical protein